MRSQFWLLLLLFHKNHYVFFLIWERERRELALCLWFELKWAVLHEFLNSRVMCVHFVHMRHLNASRMFVGKVSWHLNEVAELNVDISVRFGETFCMCLFVYNGTAMCSFRDMTFSKQVINRLHQFGLQNGTAHPIERRF